VWLLAHVPADWLTGEKALWLHGPVIGLNLYRWPAMDFVLELPLIVGGWWMVRSSPGQAAFDVVTPYTRSVGTSRHERACEPGYHMVTPR
jgi:hypothetical protein